MHFMPKLPKSFPYLALLVVLSLPALAPLAAPGYFFDAHDGRHSVFYLMQFDASLRDSASWGALWPRWAMHHIQGYGYPTFIIQAPLGFYLGEFFVLLGATYTSAAKLAWATGFLLSGWGMFALVSCWAGEPGSKGAEEPGSKGAREPGSRGAEEQESNVLTASPHHRVPASPRQLAALIAALLYVYIPYHLVDIYVRGALNDALLLAWFPWTVLAFDRLIALDAQPGWSRRLAVALLSLAGTLLTHTFALISFVPLLVLFVLFRLWVKYREIQRGGAEEARRAAERKERKRVKEQKKESAYFPVLPRPIMLSLAAGVGALLLCATFLLPLLLEGARFLDSDVYTGSTYQLDRHFVYFGQFFNPTWNFGYSNPGVIDDGMSFQIGAVALVIALAAPFLLAARWSTLPLRRRALLAFFAAATIALLWLMTPWSRALWGSVEAVAQVLQFPWRLLALVDFTACVLAGLLLSSFGAEEQRSRGAREGRNTSNPPIAPSPLLPIIPAPLLPIPLAPLLLLIPLASAPYLTAQLQTVEPWREDGRAVYRFEREHPDMIAYTAWVDDSAVPIVDSPMSADYAADDYAESRGRTTDLTRLTITQGTGQVLRHDSAGASAGGIVQMETAGTVQINVYYFPGWRVRVDGERVEQRISQPLGLIEIDVPPGEHLIEARMESTPVRTAGTIVSWAMVLVVGGLLVWPVVGNRRRSRMLKSNQTLV